MDSPLLIGISVGDITGIGPEVTLKGLAAEGPLDDTRYLLIGDPSFIIRLNETLGTKLPIASRAGGGSSRFVVENPCAPLPGALSAGDPRAARAAFEWVRHGAERCLRGDLDGMVTAPVNKEAIVRAGIKFVGQTELLSQMASTSRTAMTLLGTDDRGRWLRVCLATTHVPLRNVADHLTADKIATTIELAARACAELNLKRARIGVCGLNPHAGEGGQIGIEEQIQIGPAVKAARERGVDAVGPLSADALFHYAYRGDYDVVVAMYHDQGLAPLKMVAFERGVNWTVGLPFVRTSPDHGTAYDIAGRGIANPSSMVAALRLAKQLALGKRAGRR